MAFPNSFIAYNQIGMLDLVYANLNDICYRADLDETFILIALPPTVLANWSQIAPAGGGGNTIGITLGFGNGTSGEIVTTTAIGTGSGPANPYTVAGYVLVNLIGGGTAWLPYFE